MTQPARRALLSVYDKTGLVDFARGLTGLSYDIISTGGSARTLSKAGLKVTDVSAVTGFPEIMDGRVKTLHPAIHAGLLAVRASRDHQSAMQEHNLAGIDVLVSNLYPFQETLRSGADFAACIENIDIGGPAMTRAAAKNHHDVTVITSPDDYDSVLAEMTANGGTTLPATRKTLAARAFARTAAYDSAISTWLAAEAGLDMPPIASLAGDLRQSLRYGENPHQHAGFYVTGDDRPGVASARQIQGRELSYNNINDTDAACECASEFAADAGAAVVIVKHANPCGVAVAASQHEAWQLALRCDPVSAFGGIIALNRPLAADTATEIAKLFAEVVIAPGADAEALEILSAKKNLRVLITDQMADPRAPGRTIKTVAGGFLVQSRDAGCIDDLDLKTVTRRAPTHAELSDLKFAFKVAKHVKSNAIIYAKDNATVGIGAGQMSRVDSARIAARKSADAAAALGRSTPLAKGSVVASDAFFPFADGLLQAAEAGATAIIQPGGSMRDDEVIKAADDAGLAMVFTGMRHFRH